MKKYLALLLAFTLAAPALAIEKNVASQYLELQAIDSATGAPKTGDSANLTAYVSGDGDTTPDALTDTSATEISSTNAPGVYRWDLSQGETNFTNILFSGKSSTSGVYLVPRMLWTVPSGFATLTIANNATAANVTRYGGSAGTFASGIPAVNATQINGTSQTAFDMSGRVQTALPTIAPDAAGGLSTNLQGPRVYYVQSTGSDSNSGLIRTSPLLNPPTSAARNGDTIHFIGSNSFSAVSFTNRRVKITGDRASSTTLTITGGGGLIVASGSEICDIKIVNGSSAASSKCVDLSNVDFVNIHDVILDAGSGDQCLTLDSSAGTRLFRSKLTSAAATGIEGYAVCASEQTSGSGGATSIEIDNCYISGGRAAVYLEDRSVAEIRNSRLIATYGRADGNSVGAVLLDEHYNQGPQFRLVNTRLETTTSGSHTGVAAGITHWTNASGIGSTSQYTGEMIGGSITVTGAAGATVRHLDANLSGSSLHWSKVNHDTTKDNGSYVVKDDGLQDWGNGINKTSTNALTNTTIGTVSSIASGGITSGSFAANSITASAVASDAATEIGAAAGGAPDTRDLAPVQFTWKLSRRSENTLVSTNTLHIAPGETLRAGFDCDGELVLPGSAVLGSMTDPTTTSDDLTVTKLGIDPHVAKVSVEASEDATADGTTVYVRTTVINSNGAGPVTLVGKVAIVADPTQ